jgi:tryptophan-rich sensory protein
MFQKTADPIERFLANASFLGVGALFIVIVLRLFGVIEPGSRIHPIFTVATGLVGITYLMYRAHKAEQKKSAEQRQNERTGNLIAQVAFVSAILFMAAAIARINGYLILGISGIVAVGLVIVSAYSIRRRALYLGLPSNFLWISYAVYTALAIFALAVATHFLRLFDLL